METVKHLSAERELAQLAALRQPARLGLISKRLGRSTRCGLGQSALREKQPRQAGPAPLPKQFAYRWKAIILAA
jgi:hypothetical protein